MAISADVFRDIERLARQMGYNKYWTLDQEKWSIVAFGMVPAEEYQECEDLWIKILLERLTVKYEIPVTLQSVDKAYLSNLKKLVSRGYSCGMFDAAKENKMMVA